MKSALILASASPRRRELLAQAGYHFAVHPSSVPESRRPGEEPIRFATRLAREKAEEVFARHQPSSAHAPVPDVPVMVLGADTVVVCDHEILNKPIDDADAARMLRMLAGRTHQVITGVCLISRLGIEVAAETTRVTMLTLSDEEILAYVATREPMDKAGAYAIQGYAGRWIPRIHGCYFNVVGLPLSLVAGLLEGAEKRLAD